MSEVNQAEARVLTAEETAKIEKLQKQIENATARIEAIKAGKPAPAAKAPAYVPEVGAEVIATIGRNTATSQAKLVEGTVTAVKYPTVGEDGKAVGAIQVRVRVYAGTFDEQLVTLYPAQLKPNVPLETAAVEDSTDAPYGE